MWLIVVFGLLGGISPGPAARPQLLVSAAVSLTEALTECGTAFTAATGIGVRFNFGPSNALARQIVQGAPVDVFVSADDAQMSLAVRAGAIAPGSTAVVTTNRLVIIVPGNAGRVWSTPEPLASTPVRRIATGDPNAVPAGVYARAWLQRVGLWGAVEPKIVPTASVRGALAAVRTGAADAGIVYRTDARSIEGTTVVFEVTGRDAPDIGYPAGIIAQSPRQADARAFVEFLRGSSAQRILQRRGFGPLRTFTSP